MIERFAKITYIFLITLFALGVLYYTFGGSIKLDYKILPIFLLLIFPLLEKGYNSLAETIEKTDLGFHGTNKFKYFILVVFCIFSYLYTLSIGVFLVGLFIGLSILFKLDSRISFSIALLLLVTTACLLLIGDQASGERASIYAYYFLIIGVVLQIIDSIFPKLLLEKKSKNNSSFISEIQELTGEIINTLREKTSKAKKQILKEIGENVGENKSKAKVGKKKSSSLKSTTTAKYTDTKTLLSNNFYIKLICYFVGKIKYNIPNIVLLFFTLSGIAFVFSLYYNITNTLQYIIGGFIITYLYSKIIGTIYCLDIKVKHDFDSKKKLQKINPFSKSVTISDVEENPELLKNISLSSDISNIKHPPKKSDYFFNKAIFFASLGVIAGHFLGEYLKIGNSSHWLYVGIFILFFFVYYLVFSNLDRKIINNSKQNIASFSFKSFIKKHIYLLLNLSLIISILTVLGFKTGVFSEVYKQYQEKVGYENWSLTPEAILENEIAEKRKLGEKLKPKLDLMSQEAQIQKGTGKTLKLGGQIISQEAQIEEIVTETISVKDYHTFTQTLQLGSKNDEVLKLEEIMIALNYFNVDADNIFEEKTKDSLTNLLKTECGWPESTKGILGNQAMQCLYSLEIEKELQTNN